MAMAVSSPDHFCAWLATRLKMTREASGLAAQLGCSDANQRPEPEAEMVQAGLVVQIGQRPESQKAMASLPYY